MSESESSQSQQREGTPIAGKPTSFEPFITTRTRGEDRKAAIQSEIARCVVGPVNAKDFVNKYLPTVPAGKIPPFAKVIPALQKQMRKIKRELPMYDIWVIIDVQSCSFPPNLPLFRLRRLVLIARIHPLRRERNPLGNHRRMNRANRQCAPGAS